MKESQRTLLFGEKLKVNINKTSRHDNILKTIIDKNFLFKIFKISDGFAKSGWASEGVWKVFKGECPYYCPEHGVLWYKKRKPPQRPPYLGRDWCDLNCKKTLFNQEYLKKEHIKFLNTSPDEFIEYKIEHPVTSNGKIVGFCDLIFYYKYSDARIFNYFKNSKSYFIEIKPEIVSLSGLIREFNFYQEYLPKRTPVLVVNCLSQKDKKIIENEGILVVELNENSR